MFLILFDGYDEITDENKKGFLKKLEAFTDRFSDNYYIVSSRPCEEFVGWSRFFKYETEAFSKEKALRLINKIDYDKSVKQKFLAELNEKLYDNHKSFASNPLLLNIMLRLMLLPTCIRLKSTSIPLLAHSAIIPLAIIAL